MISRTKWSIDQEHSEIAFKVRHLMISNVKGIFEKFDANIYTVDNDFMTAEVDLWIEAASITTGDVEPDEHLKSADFFEEQKYPNITFKSISFSKGSGTQYVVVGNLTIKNVTKKVSIPFSFTQKGNDAEFNGNLTINRVDYGVGKERSSTGKKVKIELKIPATKSN